MCSRNHADLSRALGFGKALLAIDPGKNGGLARLVDRSVVLCQKMPDTHGDLAELLRIITETEHYPIVYVEEVGGYIGKPQPGSAMFKFGFGAGVIHGILLTLGAEIHMVKPQQWQKALGLGTSKGMNKTAWKNKLKSRAQELYPAVGVTLHTADALLILEFARQQQLIGGRPPPPPPSRFLDAVGSYNGKVTTQIIQ